MTVARCEKRVSGNKNHIMYNKKPMIFINKKPFEVYTQKNPN
jgi:hypothetical protein